MVGTYIFEAHTADEKFTVTAPSLEDAFMTSVKACAEIMIGTATPKLTKSHKVLITGTKLRSVLYDFLNEIIIYLDEEHILLTQATMLSLTGDEGNYSLTAKLEGFFADDVPFQTVIKNMTYSDMEIIESEQGVKLTVVVDI